MRPIALTALLTLALLPPAARAEELAPSAWDAFLAAHKDEYLKQYGADIDYRGKYAGEPWVLELFQKLPAMLEASRATCKERLGLEGWTPQAVRLAFRDGAADPLTPIQTYNAITDTRRDPDGTPYQQIIFQMEAYKHGAEAPGTDLTHELTHALMREALGITRYDGVPKWFREGTAVYAASQGPRKMLYELIRKKLDPAALVNGLDGPHDVSDYPEDELAIRHMIEAHGPEVLLRLMAALKAKEGTFVEVLAEVTGQPWEAFEAAAREHALKAVTAALPADAAACREVMALADQKRFKDAAEKSEALLNAAPDGPLAGYLTYRLGFCLLMLKDVEKGRVLIEKVARGDYPRTGHEGDALFFLGMVDFQAGRLEQAAEIFERSRRDYPAEDSLRVEAGNAMLGMVWLKLGEPRLSEGRKLLDAFLQRFPKSRLRPQVEKALQDAAAPAP